MELFRAAYVRDSFFSLGRGGNKERKKKREKVPGF